MISFFKVPFAIISSNKVITDNDGRKKRVRQYPWAEIDVENLGNKKKINKF